MCTLICEPLQPYQSHSFADLLDTHYQTNRIPTDTPSSESRFTPEILQQRIERHGGLGRLEDFATYGDDEEMYALGDFVVPDAEEWEDEAAEEFDKAVQEGFYVVKFSEIRMETEEETKEKPFVAQKPANESISQVNSEPKLKYRNLFSKPISQLLGKISMLYQSQRCPAPAFPHGSHKLLDSLAFHIMTDNVSFT